MIEQASEHYGAQGGTQGPHGDSNILSIDVSPLQKLLISLATQVSAETRAQ